MNNKSLSTYIIVYIVWAFGLWLGFTLAQPVITLNGSYPSRATVWPDTTTNGDCNHPWITCSWTTITIASWTFTTVGDFFWGSVIISGATEIIIEDNNFMTVGHYFMNRFNYNEDNGPLQSITFGENTLVDVWDRFMSDFMGRADNSLSSLQFSTGSFQTVGDRFMNSFMRQTNSSAPTEIHFYSGAFPAVGDFFMHNLLGSSLNSQLSSLIFPDGAFQTVGSNFMANFMGWSEDSLLTEIVFPEDSLQTVGEDFMSYFMQSAVRPALTNIEFGSWSLPNPDADFMYAFMTSVQDSPLTEISFPDNSLQSIDNSFMSEFMSFTTNSSLTSISFPEWSLNTVGTDFMNYAFWNAQTASLTSISFPEWSLETVGNDFMRSFMTDATDMNLDSISFPSTLFATSVDTGGLFNNFSQQYPQRMYWVVSTDITQLIWWATLASILPSVSILSKMSDPKNLSSNSSANTINQLIINQWDTIQITTVVDNQSGSVIVENVDLLFNEREIFNVPANEVAEVTRFYKVFDPDWFKNWAN